MYSILLKRVSRAIRDILAIGVIPLTVRDRDMLYGRWWNEGSGTWLVMMRIIGEPKHTVTPIYDNNGRRQSCEISVWESDSGVRFPCGKMGYICTEYCHA